MKGHLQFEYLMQMGRFDPALSELRPKRLHRLGLTMNQEGHLVSTDAIVPCDEFGLIGMRGEAIDGVDVRPDRNVFAENADASRAVDDTAGESALGCKAHEHNAGRGVAKISS